MVARSDVDPGDVIRGSLMGMAGIWDPAIEASAGYAAKLEAAGFSRPAAEQMAVDFHRDLIAGIMAAIQFT